MKKHSARVAPLSACNSPVLTLTKVRGEDRPRENIVGTADGQAMVAEQGRQSGAGKQRLNPCSTQLAQRPDLQAVTTATVPALTWFATTWNCLFFPLYYIGHLCKSPERQTPKQRFRECCRFFGDDGLTAKVFFTKVAPFGLLWIMTNYLYLQALRKINSTDVSALFCCNKAFVFLLSWIVLRDRFMGVRVSE
ncbi:putative thiamine transporter SLC35F3 [Carassius auratus]|uniref:Thiamine transporter SLC35F3 n=1 Tax=Carassius auratus TaxID=7957 RepID=A0A6P6MTQ2_CARAU|nr:putative thiamine transporter SLC35F3 [Carassius auratus]